MDCWKAHSIPSLRSQDTVVIGSYLAVLDLREGHAKPTEDKDLSFLMYNYEPKYIGNVVQRPSRPRMQE